MSHDDHGHAPAKPAPPPKPPEEITYFARTSYRNQLVKFGIKKDDRRRHVYVVGKTGMGKSVLLENMFLSDIYAGHGCCYVDPHGDTAERLIDYIPSWRINDVVYFNPSDLAFPIGFNVLEAVDERHKHLVASGMMSVFKKIWENVWSARMEYILNNTILALLDNPGSTLLGINRMLSDEEYRTRIVSNVKDPIVKQFWLKEFASYNAAYAQEAVAPIQNKIGQFLSASVIRNIVAQVKSTINIRQIMDQEKIFIINLSKGRIGEDSSRLLGGMLITKIQLAAMERVDILEENRKDFYLYVDEFQNFAVESFASILSEARKYRLCLTLAHQYIAQLSDEVREAVFGNAGTIISFRVGSPDAVFLEKEFEPRFMSPDIVNLGKYNIYLKLLIDGVASQPFSAFTLPPIAQRTASEEKVLKVTHERYTLARADIEDKVLKWSGVEEGPEGVAKLLAEAAEKKKAIKDSKKPRFEYNCSRCNKLIILPVELDRSRPIYCEECIEIVRSERKGGKPSTPSIAPLPEIKAIPTPAAIATASKPVDHPVASPAKNVATQDTKPLAKAVEIKSSATKPTSSPTLSLADLAAKAGKLVAPEDDESGPAESDVPEIPLADLAARAAKAATVVGTAVLEKGSDASVAAKPTATKPVVVAPRREERKPVDRASRPERRLDHPPRREGVQDRRAQDKKPLAPATRPIETPKVQPTPKPTVANASVAVPSTTPPSVVVAAKPPVPSVQPSVAPITQSSTAQTGTLKPGESKTFE